MEILLEEAISFIKNIPPFQFLDDKTIKEITRDLSIEFYPKGTTILYQGEPAPKYLYVIKKGEVKVSIKNLGQELFVDYRGEGELIGYMMIFGGEKSRADVLAVEDTICYLIKRDNIQNILFTNPAVREFFHKSFLNKYLEKTLKEIQNKTLVYGGSDKILFTTSVGDLSSKEVITASQDISIQEAAKIMSEKKISSLILTNKEGTPSGIITDRDLRDKVVAKGADCSAPVWTIMSEPYVKSDVKEYCFEAILKMVKHNVHHLLVMKDGKLKGILTNHDLMLIQGTSPLSIVKDIESQDTIEGLIPVSKRINNIVGLLLNEGAKASNITKIITEINDRLVRKIIEIAEAKFGDPPVPYCWISYGSEGRKEQTFKTDQDNAIIYADPSTPEMETSANEYFSKFSFFVRDGLLKCGFPPCPADFMATNPMWRKPLNEWRKYFLKWINTPTSDAVLNSVIFFDFRAIYGDTVLLDWLKDYISTLIKDNKIFLGYIANLAVKNTPPIGFLKTFVVEKSGEHKDKLNLKVKGLAPIVDIVRLFALEKNIWETSTIDRINALREKHTIVKEYSDELIHSFEFIMLLRIQHQFKQLKEGKEIDNYINPNILSNLEKRIAKETFQLISKIQDMIIERYKAMIW